MSAKLRVPIRRPKIIDPRFKVEAKYGPLGPLTAVIGHHTAGPRDKTDGHAVDLWTKYHAQHKAQGWGGIGYHIGVTSAGSIVLLRPSGLKGAHTAQANTGHLGVVVHGTVGDKPTKAQLRAIRWLCRYAHTSRMPASHRAPVKLDAVRWTGHNDWNATACPGTFKPMYVSKGKRAA